jgi:hypothetical protein
MVYKGDEHVGLFPTFSSHFLFEISTFGRFSPPFHGEIFLHDFFSFAKIPRKTGVLGTFERKNTSE